MTTKNKLILLFSLLIFPPLIIIFSHEILPNNYFFSSLYKLIFLFPIIYRVYIEKNSLKKSLSRHFSSITFKKNFFISLTIGLLLLFFYLISFFLFQDKINLSAITSKINETASINKNNIIFIGLYIIFLNSLLEEFFWRGFIYKELRNTTKPWISYTFSSIAFSFHHLVFYYSWFSPIIFITVSLGLIIYALIMNLIFQKYKDLFSCWLIHALADIAQIIIAYKIFTSI